MYIEVSNGEVVDKYTILQIKAKHISDAEKLKNIMAEKDVLETSVMQIYNVGTYQLELERLQQDLYNINLTLWNVEDQIREHERMELFNDDFIELARSVYYINDERSVVKKNINILTGSNLVEEKSYEEYNNG
jgi:hypothetical protein